ncbi:MAG: DUF47 family protein [Deltaproteobacteria bacterium]|nr:DUF47 family protein [Deltaproteobacteria bacterium]
MGLFGDGGRKELQDVMAQYCDLVGTTVIRFEEMLREYVAGDKHFKTDSKTIHEVESQADAFRLEIERHMFKAGVLPAYRQDYITLLETLDRIANKAEEAADFLYLVRPALPPELHQHVTDIGLATLKAWELLPPAVAKVIAQDFKVKKAVEAIGTLESEVDALQWTATRIVYRDLPLDRCQKMELRLFIDQIGDVSDRIENAADRLAVISIKHKLA